MEYLNKLIIVWQLYAKELFEFGNKICLQNKGLAMRSQIFSLAGMFLKEMNKLIFNRIY